MIRIVLLLAVWFLSHFIHFVASTWLLMSAIFRRDRAWTIALGYDHLGNAVTGGDPNETVSSRAYKAMTEGRRWACVLCRLLDVVQKDHCKKSSQQERSSS